jgi:peptide/nickel transport system substrate-binding protein
MADGAWTDRALPALRRRVTRRGALAMGGLAAFVAACGGGDNNKTTTTGSNATTAPSGGSSSPAAGAATSAPAGQGKVGGTFRHPVFGINSGDPPTLYPYENISYQTQTLSNFHYSRLLRGAVGPDINPTDYTKVEGDMAQGAPEQPDQVTYVFKLKPNITFHDKAPMNGRKATAQDFLATYDFFINQAINRARFAAIVDKIEAPDAQTIKFTLKGPNATFIVNGAASDQGVWFIPVETINNDQVKKDPVGTGPWVFKSYTTGVQFVWERHPKYHDSPAPYFSKIEASTNPDAQRILAALQSGDYDYSSLLPTQLADVKSKLDPKGKTVLPFSGSITGFIFNFNNTPWNDKRVRQALSMSLDRDGALKVLDPTGTGTWSSFFGPALVPHFLDPKDQAKFGPNAKYFQRNVAEAKKLLQAATGSDSLAVNVISNVDRYGPAAQQQYELVAANMREAGFNAQNVYQAYGSYIQSSYFGKTTDPKSVVLGPLIGTVLDPDDIFFTCYWSGSERHNWNGAPMAEQAQLDAMFEKQRGMLNIDERAAYIQDIQRMMADSFLTVPTISGPGLAYIQPWVQNAYYKSTYAVESDTFVKAYFTDDRIKKG